MLVAYAKIELLGIKSENIYLEQNTRKDPRSDGYGASSIRSNMEIKAMNLIEVNKKSRLSTTVGWIVHKCITSCQVPWLKHLLWKLLIPKLSYDPLNKTIIRSSILIIQSLSYMVLYALEEDVTGTVLHHIPAIITSLLELLHSINQYIEYYQLVSHKYAYKFSDTLKLKRLYYSRSELGRLATVADDGLMKVVTSYRDIIPAVSFSPAQLQEINKKLAESGKN